MDNIIYVDFEEQNWSEFPLTDDQEADYRLWSESEKMLTFNSDGIPF